MVLTTHGRLIPKKRSNVDLVLQDARGATAHGGQLIVDLAVLPRVKYGDGHGPTLQFGISDDARCLFIGCQLLACLVPAARAAAICSASAELIPGVSAISAAGA